MKTIKLKNIERLDAVLRKSKEPLSLRELARKLRVTYATAKAWFDVWAKKNKYEYGYERRGKRGPESYVVRAM